VITPMPSARHGPMLPLTTQTAIRGGPSDAAGASKSRRDPASDRSSGKHRKRNEVMDLLYRLERDTP
jgi:hypothetical protein